MEYGITAKALARTVDLTCIAIQRTAPHVIAVNNAVVGKVLVPAGVFALAGVVTVVAAVLDPKSFLRK